MSEQVVMSYCAREAVRIRTVEEVVHAVDADNHHHLLPVDCSRLTRFPWRRVLLVLVLFRCRVVPGAAAPRSDRQMHFIQHMTLAKEKDALRVDRNAFVLLVYRLALLAVPVVCVIAAVVVIVTVIVTVVMPSVLVRQGHLHQKEECEAANQRAEAPQRMPFCIFTRFTW